MQSLQQLSKAFFQNLFPHIPLGALSLVASAVIVDVTFLLYFPD
jgi:hypothetical protein